MDECCEAKFILAFFRARFVLTLLTAVTSKKGMSVTLFHPYMFKWLFGKDSTHLPTVEAAAFFTAEALQSLTFSAHREWLETNGLGGFASSTLCGVNTRRYHGLLVAATVPPVEREVIVGRFDEWIETAHGKISLATRFFPNAVYPQGYTYLKEFQHTLCPLFTFEIGAIKILKKIVMLHGENTTCIIYELLEGPETVVIEYEPFIVARNYHALARYNETFDTSATFAGGMLQMQPYGHLPPLKLFVPQSEFIAKSDWHYNFEYPVELERGYAWHEDCFVPGVFKAVLKKSEPLIVGLSIEATPSWSQTAITDELKRRAAIRTSVTVEQPIAAQLTLAADQFLVKRSSVGVTVIAGYPWFTDWGRDAAIALPGLTLVTKRFADARQILATFAANMSEGMIPNRFSDSAGVAAEYNSVDASLWFAIAAYQYMRYTADKSFLGKVLYPALNEIYAWYRRGTRYQIRMTEDGLISAGDATLQLTWMDAVVEGLPVTSRHGKAVEINAMWYALLMILENFASRLGESATAATLREQAHSFRVTFQAQFWNEAGGYLFDCVRDGGVDASIRPNQLFAVSLPFPVVSETQARRILSVIEEQLLTPVGLRTLAPGSPHYQPRYEGGPAQRDRAYHQGTVWPWLLGPWITAITRVRGERGRKEARNLVAGLTQLLGARAIGSVAEIYDADAPHNPHGCVAQAWSVAEILRAIVEDVEGVGP
jgi:predicted glycogen debranching enzyme